MIKLVSKEFAMNEYVPTFNMVEAVLIYITIGFMASNLPGFLITFSTVNIKIYPELIVLEDRLSRVIVLSSEDDTHVLYRS